MQNENNGIQTARRDAARALRQLGLGDEDPLFHTVTSSMALSAKAIQVSEAEAAYRSGSPLDFSRTNSHMENVIGHELAHVVQQKAGKN